jgi:hypothetical protein
MLKVRRADASRLAPRARRASAALVGFVLAAVPGIVAAQEAETASDRDRVMLWTAAASIGALVLAAIGYAYRRLRDMDHPTPDEIEMMGDHHDSHDASHAPHGAPGGVPRLADAEHDPVVSASGPHPTSHG